jgi:putative DNA primase/helicase
MGSKTEKKPTDFNDLHVAQGLGAVADQVNRAIAKAQDISPEPSLDEADFTVGDVLMGGVPISPDPSIVPAGISVSENNEITLEDALKRYALVFPSGDVWDTHEKTKVKVAAFKRVVGKKVSSSWLDSGNKRQVSESDLKAAADAAKKAGVRGIEEALERFTYLEPSRNVWDGMLREIVPIENLKCVMPEAFDFWNKSIERKVVLQSNLVFDPTQSVDPETHINMFRGLPLTPESDDAKCEGIRQMMFTLCNQDNEVWDWLKKWLAYPLQHVGAKMDTAVLMHSETQGSGKSMLFDGVMRPIYGEYGATLGQHQMESQYTDWQSNLLYGLFEEIFSRSKKYSQMGTVKQMVTGDKTRIEKKFVSGWEEANHMNCIFLSNELQPFPVEPSDRRFLVVWPNWKLPEDLQKKVGHEIENGGPQAFMAWLQRLDLTGFDRRSKPPMTDAKRRLIDFGLPSWEVFFREWSAGNLDAPYQTCLSDDLFVVYDNWCKAGHERTIPREKFSSALSVKITRRPSLKYDDPGGMGKTVRKDRKGTFFIISDQPQKMTQKAWLSSCVNDFRRELGFGFSNEQQ